MFFHQDDKLSAIQKLLISQENEYQSFKHKNASEKVIFHSKILIVF